MAATWEQLAVARQRKLLKGRNGKPLSLALSLVLILVLILPRAQRVIGRAGNAEQQAR